MRSIAPIDIAGGIALVAILAVAPMQVSSNYLTGVLTVCAVYGIWASSWDFMSGLTGRENFGHSLFIGAGAYTAGFLATIWFTNPWLSLPLAVVIAVAFSLLVGFPTLRLRGPYFALAMLSASAILQRLCLIFWEYTGGEEGLYGLDPLIKNPLHYYWFVLGVLVVTVIVLTLLAQSHWGLLLRAIRGDEATCQAAGINVTFYKIASLMISAGFAGLGGALYAHYQLQVSPPLFSVVVSITVIIMVYVGGIGSIYGAAVAAILLTLLTEMLRGFGEYRLWIYTLTLMLILFFLPNGLIAPLWRRVTERLR
ncbi:branched-chain amino acid ABC transporter permease [Tardiphaga sp. vice352]|uniref:branched-chain amino acid ABC transporter permease n=1 Tax=unclassified Tardiphaga TaxID=2631404 RepID=UPI001163D590|nr:MULTISPECIES: branched-chain amino acid ABC transporter permease [unclassified Tardiphaga]QDM15288.1 branched-chain amino acid ABC transporter permease [Tardiphaga sp. vice278]QDM25457.1 branched-chain amino acid ABC transporter permease [Tardiphaga sp. vice304]QDM30666.1 branched-chain amino acid ABC transporter permease [Tardiphaga sp. vice352]